MPRGRFDCKPATITKTVCRRRMYKFKWLYSLSAAGASASAAPHYIELLWITIEIQLNWTTLVKLVERISCIIQESTDDCWLCAVVRYSHSQTPTVAHSFVCSLTRSQYSNDLLDHKRWTRKFYIVLLNLWQYGAWCGDGSGSVSDNKLMKQNHELSVTPFVAPQCARHGMLQIAWSTLAAMCLLTVVYYSRNCIVVVWNGFTLLYLHYQHITLLVPLCTNLTSSCVEGFQNGAWRWKSLSLFVRKLRWGFS